MTTNYKAIDEAFEGEKEAVAAILGGNATRVIKLE